MLGKASTAFYSLMRGCDEFQVGLSSTLSHELSSFCSSARRTVAAVCGTSRGKRGQADSCSMLSLDMVVPLWSCLKPAMVV